METMNDIEKEIRQALKGQHLPKPDKALMASFDEEVWEKIMNPPPTPMGLAFILPAAAIVLLLSFGLWWGLTSKPHSQTESGNQAIEITPKPLTMLPQTEIAEVKGDIIPEASSSDLKTVSNDLVDERIRDLLILEWLGEADGLLEGFESPSFNPEVGISKII